MVEATEPDYLPCDLAFQSDRDGNLEIYKMGPDGSNQTNLTNNPADDFDPVWSADGQQIVFVSNRETDAGGGGQFIYIMNADGSDVRQVTFNEDDSQWPDISSDGFLITFTSNGDIYIDQGQRQPIPRPSTWTDSPDVEESHSHLLTGRQQTCLAGRPRGETARS